MISQNELANLLGITRSSVSVHITNLMKKGAIKGRGYIIDKDEYVCVIGGATNDMQGFPYGIFKPKDSNPGSIKMSAGGVGRNISENLARLGARVKLISVIGDDLYGDKIQKEAEQVNIDMQDTFILKGHHTATYMSILDDEGDMMAAIAHMDIFDKLTVDMLKEKKNIIEHSKICVLDTNFSEEVISYVLNNYPQVDFFLDTVSTAKAKKVQNLIGKFHTVKLNKLEAEMLSGSVITDVVTTERAADILLEKGVKNVFITLGKDGVFYKNKDESQFVSQPSIKVVNATGAGDAFMSALVYGHLEELGLLETTKLAIGTAVMALSHENTINPNLNIETVREKMEELKLC